ncbi:MAG: DUF2800 domain-containing protein [Tissierellia bacterium]|nr:DUF2800 domain-containing protein [Tissierellia bacterium]
MSHAVLSPSSSSRWLNCPPSVRLCEEFEDEVSTYALEGTAAHSLCEYRLKKALGREVTNPIQDLSFYNEEMEECAEYYTTYVMEIIGKYKKPIVLIEERLDLSSYVKNSFGTADALVLGDKDLHIMDYKHGQGVVVSAFDNPQLKLYGLGALHLFDDIYDIEKVHLHIVQPRRENISEFEITKEELYQWAEEELRPKAELAFQGEGEFSCGDWCRFCKAKNKCRKRSEMALEIAREEFKLPPLLSEEEMEDALLILDGLESWIKDIKEYALKKALEGHKWKGYKLVEGRANRRYINEEKIAKLVKKLGYEPYEQKLKGITAMSKMLGKKEFEEKLGSFLERPRGKPTLVPRSDKREEMETVKDEFGGKNYD